MREVRSWSPGLRAVISTKSFTIETLNSPGFLLIFTGHSHDISVMIWRAHEYNNLLLIPSKFRRTLIVYFQLIMQFLQKLILMSQPPKQSAVGSWENSSEMLNSWNGFRRMSSWAAAYNSFFCWDRAAFFCQNGRAGTFKFKIEKQKNVDKDARRGFVFALAYFFFGLLYYTYWRTYTYKNT